MLDLSIVGCVEAVACRILRVSALVDAVGVRAYDSPIWKIVDKSRVAL